MKLLKPDAAIAALEQHVILPNSDLSPTLGVIIKQAYSADEYSYLKSILNLAKKYNANVLVEYCTDVIAASEIIHEFKKKVEIDGIIILSSFGDSDINRALANMIPPRLDLDCMSSTAMGMLITNPSPIGYRFGPCAPVAAMKILEYEEFLSDLSGLKVAVLGRSLRVGRPLAEMLTQHNATVTCFHSKSDNLSLNLKNYDVVISAMGQPKKINSSMVDSNTLLIDIGINVDPDTGSICGDFDIESFKDTDVSITPVPGCIGKLATVVLFSKLFTNACKLKGNNFEC